MYSYFILYMDFDFLSTFKDAIDTDTVTRTSSAVEIDVKTHFTVSVILIPWISLLF